MNLKKNFIRILDTLRSIPSKFYIITMGIQFLLISIIVIIFGLVPVKREINKIGKIVSDSSNIKQRVETKTELLNRYLLAKHHESVLSNTIELAKADSIALIIDLQDSVVKISFKGVDLQVSRITEIIKNSGLRKMPFLMLDSLFSGPFYIEKDFSSIEKFPIVVKKAPKDTIEAEQLNKAPELPKQSDVFFFFIVNEHFIIEVAQNENELIGNPKVVKQYRKKKRDWIRQRNIDQIKDSQNPNYIYQLTVKIPREEARSIYRALPVYPVVLIRH